MSEHLVTIDLLGWPIAAMSEFISHNGTGRSVRTWTKVCHCGSAGRKVGGNARSLFTGASAVIAIQYTGKISIRQVSTTVA